MFIYDPKMKAKLCFNILLFTVVVFATEEKVTFENYKVFRIFPESKGHLDFLHQLEDSSGNVRININYFIIIVNYRILYTTF